MFNPIQLLNSNNYAVYSRPIARLLGSINAAILLSELIDRLTYYHRQGVVKKFEGREWFFVTVNDMQERTLLSKDEQLSAIEILKKNNIVVTKQMGLPAKRYFSVNEDSLLKMMGVSKNKEVTTDSNMFYSCREKPHLESKIEIIEGNPDTWISEKPTRLLNQKESSKEIQNTPSPLKKRGDEFSFSEREKQQAKGLVKRFSELLRLEKPDCVLPSEPYLERIAKLILFTDKRSSEKVLSLVECCLRDGFYREKMFKTNGLSILRKQFDSLEIRFSPEEMTRRLSPDYASKARDYCCRYFRTGQVCGDAWVCTVGVNDIEFVRGAICKPFFYETKTFFDDLREFADKIGLKIPD